MSEADTVMDIGLARAVRTFRESLDRIDVLSDRDRRRIAEFALQMAKDTLEVERQHFRASLEEVGLL